MRTLSLYDSDGNVCVGSIEMGIDSKLKCTVLSLSLSLFLSVRTFPVSASGSHGVGRGMLLTLKTCCLGFRSIGTGTGGLEAG